MVTIAIIYNALKNNWFIDRQEANTVITYSQDR
jgi:hypothetical protein